MPSALGQYSENERLEFVRRAIERGLAAPDEAYAQGLLAETSLDAVAHFERAVGLQPFHHSANAMLGWMLLFLGRFEEARDRAALGSLLFPEDPNFMVLQATVSVLKGEEVAANDLLKKAQRRLAPDQAAVLEATFAFLKTLTQFNWGTAPDASLSKQLMSDLVQKIGAASLGRLGATDLEVQQENWTGDSYPTFGIRLPPVLGRIYHPVLSAMLGVALNRDLDKAIADLSEALRVHREGTLFHLQACCFLLKGRWEDAERAARLAVETPCMFPVRPHALYVLIMSETYLAWLKGPGTDDEMASRAIDNVRRLISLGPIRPHHFYPRLS